MAILSQFEKQSTFRDTLRSYNRSFWIASLIQLMERWAYWGTRAILPLYLVSEAVAGGLGGTHHQRAEIFMWWAFIQAILPLFVGGYADRFGCKKTMRAALFLSIVGYLVMGIQQTYGGFLFGWVLASIGVAVLKPANQTVVALSTNKQSAPLGWSFFFFVVNVGAFIGTFASSYFRILGWKTAFFSSAAILAFNYLFLSGFVEPTREGSSESAQSAGLVSSLAHFYASLRELLNPRLLVFLSIFSGFSLVVSQLISLLPTFLTEWADFSVLRLSAVQNPGMVAAALIAFVSGSLILFSLPIAWFFGKIEPIPALLVCLLVTSVGMALLGIPGGFWLCLVGLFLLSFGPMFASLRRIEYLSSIAPAGKTGQYMGYDAFPEAIGWVFGLKIGGFLYSNHGDKLLLAKRYMVDHLHWAKGTVERIPPEKVLSTLTEQLHLASTQETTRLLFQAYHPERIWLLFAAIGLASSIGMLFYLARRQRGQISSRPS